MTEEAASALLFDAAIYAACIGIVMAGVAVGIALIRAAWKGGIK
ncbi:hypothetical protein [Mesorhizobium sp. M1B.F.Ca.ET.045.04.1.1]|nr:hypothetical protein [Mesorhizobium sp. M1B.F.Ca.ET.045.04.1.1]